MHYLHRGTHLHYNALSYDASRFNSSKVQYLKRKKISPLREQTPNLLHRF